ncbi:myb-related transcription factor, partner of profilin-like [Pleurodeles waltl]|uniref:myb-related transcription factor, partner of profilin-like n=1 Tax=Pleurodeles waltl TaxID=8319 RepID=UPI0037097093
MDPRGYYRPQEDDSRPGTSQEDPYRNQEIFRKKRKCRFSEEEQEILVKEVTEHQHQLFISSKLPLSRREAIWKQIVDKINSVAEERCTVTECKKRWHDCKRRTKEKMARNRKAAMQTGGGSPAQQEALDHMEEMVAAVIPEEIVTGIQGQDSADYHDTSHMQEEHGSPADMPVPEFPEDMDDEPINIPQETIQMVLESLQTPPSVTRRSTEEAATTVEPPATPIVRPASSNTAEDSDDTGTSFERTVVGVQRELAKEVRVGMQTMAASLEGVRSCMMSTADQAAAMQARTSLLQELLKTQKEICTAVIQLTQQLQLQASQRVHECNIEPLRADLAAYHRDVAAILKNQQALLAAVLPFITPQGAAPGMSASMSSNTEVCVAPSQPTTTRTHQATHTSEEEDME